MSNDWFLDSPAIAGLATEFLSAENQPNNIWLAEI